MHFHPFDWIVLIAYFLLTMAIGFYFYKRTRSTEGYTTGNRTLPGWACGLSIMATYLSSISYLSNAGKSFTADWNAFVFTLTLPLTTLIAVVWFLPYYRKGKHVSAYAQLENRFGAWARVYASIFYLLTQIARIGVIMYLTALPLQVIFEWNIYVILIGMGLCVTIYSLAGGIVAVIWTDAIQAIVLMGGAVICLAIMLFEVPGGVAGMLETASEHHKFSLGEFFNPASGAFWSQRSFWVILLYGVAINLQNFGIDQSYIQRYISSRSDKEARNGLWLGGLLYVPLSALFFLIGTTLFVQYEASKVPGTEDMRELRTIAAKEELYRKRVCADAPEYEAKLEAQVGELEKEQAETGKIPKKLGDRAFPHFISKHLPPGLTGLLIAAVFAAAMSSISTGLNSSATLIMTDFFKRFLRPSAGEKSCMLVLYGSTVAWGVFGTVLAVYLISLTESVLDIWWTLSGVFGGGICGLFLLGIMTRVRKPAAVGGVIVGALVLVWMSIPKFVSYYAMISRDQALAERVKAHVENWDSLLYSPFHVYFIPVFAILVILLSGFLFGYLFGTKKGNAASGKEGS